MADARRILRAALRIIVLAPLAGAVAGVLTFALVATNRLD